MVETDETTAIVALVPGLRIEDTVEFCGEIWLVYTGNAVEANALLLADVSMDVETLIPAATIVEFTELPRVALTTTVLEYTGNPVLSDVGVDELESTE